MIRRDETPLTTPGRWPGPPPLIIVIGASAGGPIALSELIPSFPASFPVPLMVVQHMPQITTRLLANRLDGISPLRVVEAIEGESISTGTVYIAPGDRHMIVDGPASTPVVGLNSAPRENHCRPAVDVLFFSAAECFGAGVLGVILTGMGSDGLRGCRKIHDRGGRIIAQDEESSSAWEMPETVVQAGLGASVLSLKEIAAEIMRRMEPHRSARYLFDT